MHSKFSKSHNHHTQYIGNHIGIGQYLIFSFLKLPALVKLDWKWKIIILLLQILLSKATYPNWTQDDKISTSSLSVHFELENWVWIDTTDHKTVNQKIVSVSELSWNALKMKILTFTMRYSSAPINLFIHGCVYRFYRFYYSMNSLGGTPMAGLWR